MMQLESLVKKLQAFPWDWTSDRFDAFESLEAALGLKDRTTGSESSVSFRSPDPGFPPPDPDYPIEQVEHPFTASIASKRLSSFSIVLGMVDMYEALESEGDDYDEFYRKKHAEYVKKFKTSLREIKPILGTPAYRGKPGDESHPVGWSFEEVAMWPIENARIILGYGQEDKELPIVLELVVCPLQGEVH
jgi:hypothetical protein